MPVRDPRSLTPRAILEVGDAFLDCRHLGARELERRFPTAVASCRARGYDPATDLLPVAPAAHYLIGGIATDLEGRTSLPPRRDCSAELNSGKTRNPQRQTLRVRPHGLCAHSHPLQHLRNQRAFDQVRHLVSR